MKQISGFWSLLAAPVFLAICVLFNWVDIRLGEIFLIFAIGTTLIAAVTLYLGWKRTMDKKIRNLTLIGGVALGLTSLSFWLENMLPSTFAIVFLVGAAFIDAWLGLEMTGRKLFAVLIVIFQFNLLQYLFIEEFTEWGLILLAMATILLVLDYFGVLTKKWSGPKPG